jgi:hypothetical protein
MLEFIASMMDVGGHVPMVGDADDGYVVRLSPEPGFDNFRSLLATGAVLFDRPDLAQKAGSLDDKTQWLLGPSAATWFRENLPRAPRFEPRRAFPSSGYYLLGDRFESVDEVRMLADAGPLGYLSIAAHGHADALSVVLSVAGHEVLVDPGTYAYHTEPQWRRYFRSTRAHNTVMVDDRDQSEQSGNFMWSRHANARVLEWRNEQGRQRFYAEHDGYRCLSDPATHRREIVYDELTRTFTIVDTIECEGTHQIKRHWHFAESLQPQVSAREIDTRIPRYRVRVVSDGSVDQVEELRGGSAQQGGWVSRSFGSKESALTVAWSSTVRGTTTLRTHIYIERD